MFSKHFDFSYLSYSILYISIGSCFCEKNYLWSMEITRSFFVIIWITNCIFFCFMLGLVPTSSVEILCTDRGVVYSQCSVVIPRWRSFCGKSCVDIVKILLCEDGNVEQWLKPQNISLCLRLDFLSNSISLYILYCFTLFIFIC